MALIDSLIEKMSRSNARAAVIGSGRRALLEYAEGDQVSDRVMAHGELVALLDEIAPAAALDAARAGRATVFDYRWSNGEYRFAIEPTLKGWVVRIEPVPASQRARATVAISSSPVAAAGPASPLDLGSSSNGPPSARSASPSAPVAPVVPSVPASSGEGGAASIVIPSAIDPRLGGSGSIPAGAPVPTIRPSEPLLDAESPSNRASPVSVAAAADAQRYVNVMEQLLTRMRSLGGSDLHLSVGTPPMLRHDGSMRRFQKVGPIDSPTMTAMLRSIAPSENWYEFEERFDTDFAYEIAGVARFRANYFRDRNGPGAVFRQIPMGILSSDDLGLPKAVTDLCMLTKGLVLVTGPTGSGKSTTLAALIDYVNRNRDEHIITIEDPIEFVHENKRCLVNQREVFRHTRSFKDALRAALREDPDIVLVGEMRDLETIAIAVETAETGHLVFGTLHTTTAASTVDRIIDQFPADRQEQVRQMLADNLKGVVAQTLCKQVGGGRVAAYEILLGTSAVSNLIRERKTFQVESVMQTSRGIGMQTLNDALLALVRAKTIDPMEAYRKAVSKAEFRGLLARENIRLPALDL